MPELKTFLHTDQQDLIIQIRISEGELLRMNSNLELFETICSLDKKEDIVSQIKALLLGLEALEELKDFDPSIFVHPFQYAYVSYSTQNSAAQNLANAAAQTNSFKQSTHVKPPPQQPSRFRPFNHCRRCGKRNTWNIYNCVKCLALLNYT